MSFLSSSRGICDDRHSQETWSGYGLRCSSCSSVLSFASDSPSAAAWPSVISPLSFASQSSFPNWFMFSSRLLEWSTLKPFTLCADVMALTTGLRPVVMLDYITYSTSTMQQLCQLLLHLSQVFTSVHLQSNSRGGWGDLRFQLVASQGCDWRFQRVHPDTPEMIKTYPSTKH